MSVFVTGQRELIYQLKKIAAAPIARNALNDGAKILVSAIRQEAPRGKTGNLRKGISERWVRARYDYVGTKKIGVNVARRPTRNEADHVGGYAYHGHLVALGTKPRFTKTGASRGVMPSNDFVGRGYRKASATVVSVMTARIRQDLQAAS